MTNEPMGDFLPKPFEKLSPVDKNTEFQLYLQRTFDQSISLRNESKEQSNIFPSAMKIAIDTEISHMLHYANIIKPMKDFIALYVRGLMLYGEGEDVEAMVWFHDTDEGVFSNDPNEIKKLTAATREMILKALMKRDKNELEQRLFDSKSPIWNIMGEWNKLDGGNFVLK